MHRSIVKQSVTDRPISPVYDNSAPAIRCGDICSISSFAAANRHEVLTNERVVYACSDQFSWCAVDVS